MRNWLLLLALLVGVGVYVVSTQPAAVGADDDKDRVGQLIKQLGSPKFAIRDRAKKELESMGPAALDALRKAAKSEDMEISRRAGELVKRFEDKIAIDNLLAPKKVNLNLKDATVLEAINELSKQSGYPIQIDGDRTGLSKRKITLATGETTFWQAFDQLCQKGNLTEVTNNYNPYNTPIYRGGIQVQPFNPPPRIIVQPMPLLQPPNFKLPQLLPQIKDKDAKEMLERMQKMLEEIQKELDRNGNFKLPKFQPGVKPNAPAFPQMQKEMEKELQKLLEKMLEQLQKENPQLPQLPALPKLPPLKQGGLFQMQNNAFAVQAPAVAKVQIKQAPVAKMQPAFQPIGGKGIRPNPYNINNGQITVREGAPAQYPTSYAGAVRVRVVPMSQQGIPNASKQPGERLFVLEATGEPRMQGFTVIGNAMIDKALDDLGQSLFVTMADPQNDNGFIEQPNGIRIMRRPYNPYMNLQQRHIVVRLKAGEKQSKLLKELKGSLTAQMLSAPEALITFDNLLKAAGKEAKGANGGKVEVVSVEQVNGDVRVKIRLENAQNVNGGVIINNVRAQTVGGFNTSQGVVTVRDAKGKDFQFVNSNFHASRFVNGVINQEFTLTFRPNGAEEPAALVFNGHRTLTMQVPFSFTNVPLE